MISSITAALPCRYENLKRLFANFALQTADGQLSGFKVPNSNGDLFADFTKPGATARKTTGPLQVSDGNANLVIDVPDATIEIEQGANDPDWPGVILGNIVVVGMETNSGEVWMGRSTGIDPADPTSLQFEFAKSSSKSVLGQLSELHDHFNS